MGKGLSCGDQRLMEDKDNLWMYSFTFNQPYNRVLTDAEVQEAKLEMLDQMPLLKEFLNLDKGN